MDSAAPEQESRRRLLIPDGVFFFCGVVSLPPPVFTKSISVIRAPFIGHFGDWSFGGTGFQYSLKAI
jgi:hypothetical protein